MGPCWPIWAQHETKWIQMGPWAQMGPYGLTWDHGPGPIGPIWAQGPGPGPWPTGPGPIGPKPIAKDF